MPSASDPTVGGQYQIWTCRPLTSGETAVLGAVPRTRGTRWGCSKPPSPIPPITKGGAGRPLTTSLIPPIRRASPSRHSDVISPSPAAAPHGPPRSPATVLRPPPCPATLASSSPSTSPSVPRARHDVMLTSSAEKCQMTLFVRIRR